MPGPLFSCLLFGAWVSQGAASLLVSKSPENGSIRHWLYNSDLDDKTTRLLDRDDIEGVQVLYRWRDLELEKDQYNFTQILTDLEVVQNKGKKLWVQLQDRTATQNGAAVPKYLKETGFGQVPQCYPSNNCTEGTEVSGWVACQWNPLVRQRFKALLDEMSRQLDGKIYGLNFPETSIAMGPGPLSGNFTAEEYFRVSLENAKYGASVFNKTFVVQYVNFWPEGTSEENFMSDSFAFYAQNKVGIGGPDNLPYRRFQENNSYPYLWEYRNKVPISVIAVQEPDLDEGCTTPPPLENRYNCTKEDWVNYAVHKLGSQIIFWTIEVDWLRGQRG